MLNILFITEDFYPAFIGGQGIYGYHLVSGLVKKGCDVTVLAEKRKGRKIFWQNRKHIQVILTPFCFGNQLLLALFEYFYFIFRLRAIYFDIVHANQLSGLFFVAFKPKNVKKVIVSVHNTNRDLFTQTESALKRFFYRPLIFLERAMYRRADAVLFHSPSEKQAVTSYYSLEKTKLGMVHMGVSSVHVREKQRLKIRTEMRKYLKLKEDEKIVLCVTRLVKRKNVDAVLAALRIVQNEALPVRGVIIGDGFEKQYLQSISPPNVSFLGFLDNPAVREFYLAADIFVLLSVAEGGVSLAAMEAASHGLPLILSRDCANSGILVDGQNGYIADPNDPKGLAEKIKNVFLKATQMGEESKKVVRPFTWEKTTGETLSFYESLLQKR